MSAFLGSAFGSGLITVLVADYHGLTFKEAAPYAGVVALLLGFVAWLIEEDIAERKREKTTALELEQFRQWSERQSSLGDAPPTEPRHGG